MRTWTSRWGWIVGFSLLAGCAQAPDATRTRVTQRATGVVPATAKQSDKAKPTESSSSGRTHKVEKGPFKVEVAVKGVFESKDMSEIAIRTEAWAPNPLVVMKAVPHGTAVKKGEPVLWLDLEKIDQAIKDLETDRRLAELTLKQSEFEVPILEKATPMDLALAERAKQMAEEDLTKFKETDRAQAEKMVHFSVKNSRNFLEYTQEELKQLEKMYRNKDIREETEEIILRRQRHMVEMYTFMLQMAEQRRDDALKITIPRMEKKLTEESEKLTLALDKAKATLPLTLSQKKLALEKAKYEAAKATDKLTKLKRDRETLTVKAPADGIVYYGKCNRGQWSTAAQVSERLRRGGILQPEEVVLTIVNPKGLLVRGVVEEKDLAHLRTGMTAKIAPTAHPDRKLTAKVDHVSAVPVTPGNFEATFQVNDLPATLVAGMACTVKLIPYRAEYALTVPASAVFADELDDDKHFVYLPKKGAKPEKRVVTVGKTSGGKTEITGGLQEGDEILLDRPDASPKLAGTGIPNLLGD